ncbi:MAG: SusC/RagA family TonB-linked outer membrane protein [Bacteroides sp.]|nr:SusC/RagA family TonB-linked outer membrane protein [Bacteroides sp.]
MTGLSKCRFLFFLAVLVFSASLYAQQIQISGSVKDTTGEPMIGVNVLVGGQEYGVITDMEGNYHLEAPADGELIFSYIGMNTLTEKINNRRTIHVILTENTVLLGNVVVTALGIKREEKALGYSVQKVEGDILQTVKGLNVGTSLSGKIAGVKVLNSSEFAEDPNLTVRGETPILVIDGVPYKNLTLSDIPADNIEEISVLKGATASALYGARGGSGAIMITTKKGADQKGLSVAINSSTMFTAGYLAIPEAQSTFGRGTSGVYNQTADRVWGQVMDGTMIEQWDPVSKTFREMPYLPVGKNNFKNFVEQGFVTNNNLSVAQKGEYGTLRASASWIQNKGQYPNNRINKYSYSLGGEMNIDKFTLSSSMSYTKHESPNAGFNGYKNYDPMYSLLIWTGADYGVRQYRDYWVVKDEKQNNSYDENINSLDNPYFQQYERTRSIDKDVFSGMFNAGYELLPWLRANIRLGLDYYSSGQEVKISQGNMSSSGEDYGWSDKLVGHYANAQESGWSINNDFLLSGEKTFNDFTVEGLLGGSIYYINDKTLMGNTVGGISIPGYFSLKASVKNAAVTSTLSKMQTNSLYGRVGLSWRSTVYLEGTLRNDWSSTLPESTRSYMYPSISGSLIASELLPKTDWLSLWKLRGSWTISKTPASIYENNVAYSIGTNVWGNMPSASLPSSVKNSDIKPTAKASMEIGTMVSLLRNRLSFDLAYYNTRLYNRIVSQSVSGASGYSTTFINTNEEISTRGFEFSINATPVKMGDWQWDINTNWTKYGRYYTRLDDEFSADKPWVKKGERYDAYIIKDFQYSPDGKIIRDNGVPLYSAYDSVWGYSDPDWIWGVGTTLRYKNFTLNVAVDGHIGGLTPTVTEAYMWLAGSHPKSVVPERFIDSEQAVAGNKDYPGSYIGKGVKVVSGLATYDTYGNIVTDDRVYAPNDVAVKYKSYIDIVHRNFIWGVSPSPLDVYSTTFLKLREISLTYDLPREISKKFRCQSAAVSFVGQNVLM